MAQDVGLGQQELGPQIDMEFGETLADFFSVHCC